MAAKTNAAVPAEAPNFFKFLDVMLVFSLLIECRRPFGYVGRTGIMTSGWQ